MQSKRFFTARNIAFLAVLVALIVVLQLWGGNIRIGGTPLSFVLVPIVIGAVMLGPGAGALLGFLFGVITVVMGVLSDPFTQYLFADNPAATIVLCLLKGTAAGLVPGLLYKLIARKNGYVGAVVASLAAPVCNTGIFVVGCLLMSGTIGGFMQSVGSGGSVVYFVIIVMAGWNFVAEFIISAVLSPVVYTVVRVVGRSVGKKQSAAPSRAPQADEAVRAQRADGAEECPSRKALQE